MYMDASEEMGGLLWEFALVLEAFVWSADEEDWICPMTGS